MFDLFLLPYRIREYVSYGFPVINFRNPGVQGDKTEKNEMGWACGAYG